MSDLKEFRLPDVGEGLTEADIIRWHVKPGDTVTVNQIIVEIETAKAVVELPSPYAGTVAGLLVPEGATADVGTPIISVDVGGGAQNGGTVQPADDLVPALPQPEAAEAAEPPEPGAPSVLVGYGVKLGRTTRRTRRTAPAPSANGEQGRAPAQAPASAPVPAATTPERGTTDAPDRGSVFAKPPVRKMARDLGVDLSALTGTGPNGSITRDDVQQAATVVTTEPVPLRPAGSALLPTAGGAREERVPVRGVRKATAAAMTASAFTAPHVTEFLQIDITETMAATIRLRALPEFEGVRVSPLLLVARALVVAAGRHPMINASWDDAAREIVIRHYVNLGIAVATERGLIVPNVKDAQALSLPALAQALNQLTGTTRAGKATPADLSGGTITITNVGVFGVDSGTPILTPGEAANLAFGQVRQAPWVVDGQLAVRDVCTLALSFDHRIVDGELGSAVLRDVGAMLTDPLRMLAWS
jgi:2-oxoisovalerate dehydrogenase E2 component (dihydrolipoyl transacylase)